MVVLDADGRTSFQALQNALTAKDAPLSFFAFDLVYLDGYDLRSVVLTERKRLLRGIVGDGVGVIRVGPEVQGHGDEFFKQACTLRLEGAVCKRADSLYHDGARTRDWVKVKCTRRQEMVIGGYTDPQGSRNGFGALLLGIYDNGKLRYAARSGPDSTSIRSPSCTSCSSKREQDKPAFVNPPRGFEAKGAHWVKPDLVAEIAFTEWSDDGALRHPSFQGLRTDKKATDVVREEPQAAPSPAPAVEDHQGHRDDQDDSPKTRRPRRTAKSRGRHGRRHRHFASGQALFPRSRHHQDRGRAILRAHGVVDPAPHQGSPAGTGPLSRRLDASSASIKSTPTRA